MKKSKLDKIKIDYLVKNIFTIIKKNFIIAYNKNEKGSFYETFDNYDINGVCYLEQYSFKEGKMEFIIDKKVSVFVFEIKYLKKGLLCVSTYYSCLIWSSKEIK